MYIFIFLITIVTALTLYFADKTIFSKVITKLFERRVNEPSDNLLSNAYDAIDEVPLINVVMLILFIIFILYCMFT